MSLDIHNNVKVTQVSHAAATGGDVYSSSVDMAGFNSLEFVVSAQPSTATTPTYAFEVQEGATSTPTEAVGAVKSTVCFVWHKTKGLLEQWFINIEG